MDYGRISLDQWLTPLEWAQACVDDLLKELPELDGRLFVEPGAGAGAFMDALKERGQDVEGYDIDPLRAGVFYSDFLTDDVECEGTVVIGNPPYGVRHALSRAFAKRAFELGATHVAFLLPLGFMRTTIASIGRRVEYFKDMEGMSFETPTGGTLRAPAKQMAWIVLSADPLQPSTQFFEAVEFEDADSFWLQGVEYSREACQPVRYTKAVAPGRFTGTRGDGKRITGTAYRRLDGSYEDSSLLHRVASLSGNSVQPTAATANFLLSHPEVYRGELAL